MVAYLKHYILVISQIRCFATSGFVYMLRYPSITTNMVPILNHIITHILSGAYKVVYKGVLGSHIREERTNLCPTICRDQG